MLGTLLSGSVLPISPVQGHFSEIPVANTLFTYLIGGLLSCQFSLTAGKRVFIINPVLLDAPLVLMSCCYFLRLLVAQTILKSLQNQYSFALVISIKINWTFLGGRRDFEGRSHVFSDTFEDWFKNSCCF